VKLVPRSRGLLEKVIVTQLVKKFSKKPQLLWNPKVYYHVHKILVSVLSQMNAGPILTLSFFKIHFNIVFSFMPRSAK